MKKKINNVLFIIGILLIIFILAVILIIYASYSGSCKLRKKYICNEEFCLYKEFDVVLQNNLKKEINHLLMKKDIQKRVDIITYPETLFHCALPNKKGITISTMNVVKYAPKLIYFYQNTLCKINSIFPIKFTINAYRFKFTNELCYIDL